MRTGCVLGLQKDLVVTAGWSSVFKEGASETGRRGRHSACGSLGDGESGWKLATVPDSVQQRATQRLE